MLFKISKGLAKDLPTSKTPGHMWLTQDDGKLYVDISDSERICLNDIPTNLYQLLEDESHNSVGVAYYYNGAFYEESAHTNQITPTTNRIYFDLTEDKVYRYNGSSYIEVGSLKLGETATTAYRGDRGKIAYDHSQATHARTDATKTEASETNGNIKINGTETTVYTHPGSGTNPHGTTASDVGLGNVGNFKAVSTEASQGLTATEQTNARHNIGEVVNIDDVSLLPQIGEIGVFYNLTESGRVYLWNGNQYIIPSQDTDTRISRIDFGVLQENQLDIVETTGARKSAIITPTISYNNLTNKPTLGTASSKDVATSGDASTTEVVMGNDSRLSDSRNAADVHTWAKESTKPTYTKSEVGLGNVGNFKAVSTEANQGLTSTEQTNARANIDATKTESSTTNGNILIDGTETAVYTHPTQTAQSAGLYKITTDGTGHVTAATTVEKSDITGLGIPSQDTTYTVETAVSGGTDESLVTTGEKFDWNEKANVIEVTQAEYDAMSQAEKNADVVYLISDSPENHLDFNEVFGEFSSIEYTDTASKDYAVGDYLVNDGKFYRVTTAIAQGDIIASGTNVIKTTVGHEVALNNIDILKNLGDFASVEQTNTASKAYAVGDYLVNDSKFYRVTNAIAQGDTITPGTNVVKTTVGDETNRLNLKKANVIRYQDESRQFIDVTNETYQFYLRLGKGDTSVKPSKYLEIYCKDDGYSGTDWQYHWVEMFDRYHCSVFMDDNSNNTRDKTYTGAVPFNTVTRNIGNAWNTSTHEFICPVTGLYHASFTYFSNYTKNTTNTIPDRPAIMVNGTQVCMTNGWDGASLSIVVYCGAGAKITAGAYSSTFPVHLYAGGNHNFFEVTFLGNV